MKKEFSREIVDPSPTYSPSKDWISYLLLPINVSWFNPSQPPLFTVTLKDIILSENE